ncbi:MAG: alanine dehydrogenase [Actinobacteria bacterium]|nr:alanine dehydrogenase [Actinomycetota bacterium]
MRVGVPKEIKTREYRVGMVPASVRALTARGHTVSVETGAGLGSGITDEEYAAVGATIAPDAETVFANSDMIVKVKEPQSIEFPLLREGQVLYTYLHLAPAPELTKALLERKIVGIAYETIQPADGSLPLLTPMSEVAGRLSVQAGAHCLETAEGGRGQLLGGVPGTKPGKVVIIGGGVVGLNAAKIAVGLGARVTILDLNLERLRALDDVFRGRVCLVASSEHAIAEEISDADLVVGGVLVAGARAPRLITREMLRRMPEGSVIVDVAVDQGGCVETTRPTTHDDPTYVVEGVIHYCVANMPSAVARTSTFALSNATLPYALKLADGGYRQAMLDDPALRRGLNVIDGKVTYRAVAGDLGYAFTEPEEALALL